jgi:hypothetical protein
MPTTEGALEIKFDLVRHELIMDRSDGRSASIELYPRSVSDFYEETTARLHSLGVNVAMHAAPVEVEDATPFADDTHHHSYDSLYVERFWRSLLDSTLVLERFRASFTGKASPVHFFWGSFDLAATRFSGRPAPKHPGGAPHCPDWVMEIAYSDECSSCGYWPGGDAEGVFYSYAYPIPEGFDAFPIDVAGARYDNDLGEFVIGYDTVRQANNPDELLTRFLEATFHAAASLAHWDAV